MAAAPTLDREEIKAYALKLCLDFNYAKLDGQVPSASKDKSYLLLEYQLDEIRPRARTKLHAFVTSQTANYALAQVPMKDEAGHGPFNKIFSQCMGFYRSKALEDFIARQR
ncbi:hypothetical protein AAD027_18730 [Pseudoxanthomonas putridarboris]|uniref:Uncharacterized protein n=2 Tax=Pseudoxanthomonas putridarboris TaxID=752605 RepID=A0ABU9J639_9GAMM